MVDVVQMDDRNAVGTAPDDEAEQVASFMEGRGIPIDRDPVEASNEETLGEEIDVPDKVDGPATGHKAREVSRILREKDTRIQQLVDYANGLINAMAASQQPAAAPAGAAPPEPEEELADPVLDPEKYTQQVVSRATKPYQERIEKLEQFLDKIAQNMAGQNQQHGLLTHVATSERQAMSEFPDYSEAVRAYEYGVKADLREMYPDMPEEQVHRTYLISLEKVANTTRDPARLFYSRGKRYLQLGIRPPGEAAPARRAAPAGGAASAASRARSNGAAESLSGPARSDREVGTLSVESLLANGVRPQDLGNLLRSPNGRAQFLELARRAERQGE